jgi:Fe2+ transport system protein FeoA
MKLTDIPPGIAFRTTRIVGGQEATRRLTHIGFSIGAQATVIEKQADGPVMVNINGQQVSSGAAC